MAFKALALALTPTRHLIIRLSPCGLLWSGHKTSWSLKSWVLPYSTSWKISKRFQRCAERADPGWRSHILVQRVQCSNDTSLPSQCSEYLLRAEFSFWTQCKELAFACSGDRQSFLIHLLSCSCQSCLWSSLNQRFEFLDLVIRRGGC